MNFSFCHSLPFSRSVGTSMLGPMPAISPGARARANSSRMICPFSTSADCSEPP